jgi:outer membrane protein TolC
LKNKLEEDVLRRQIVSRVSSAYWTASGAVKAKDLLQRELDNFERVVEYNRSRVKEGAAPELDLLRIEVERDRLTSSVKIAQQDADRAAIALFREMGKTEFPSVEFVDSLDEVRPVPRLSISMSG